MYDDILKKYRAQRPQFPEIRRPLVGSVIKEMRIDQGIRQEDFARASKVNLSTLKSIENDHQQATTVENINRFAHILGVTPDKLILYGREWDPANSFALKKSAPQPIRGIRAWKKIPGAWFPSIQLHYRDFDITPISPPLSTQKDFFFCRLLLPPKRKIAPLQLATHQWVIGFVSTGFDLKINHAGQTHTLTGNQGFALDGFYPHSVHNEDEQTTAVIYLMAKTESPSKMPRGRIPRTEARPGPLSIAKGIEVLRTRCSDRPEIPISVQHLADLTDQLDHEQIRKMMRLKKGSSVVYWAKIEDLLGATHTSMEDFLDWSQNKEKISFSLATAKTRARIEYPTYGVKFYSATPGGAGNQFYCGELTLEGRSTIKRDIWSRRDNAMIGIYVEEGEAEIAVGTKRSVLPLLKGESIYFDGALGYQLRNPGEHQTKIFFASCPGIQL